MSLFNLLNQVVTITPRSGYDADGRETFSTSTSYQARVQEVSKSRFLPNGQVLTIDAIADIEGSPTVNINDKLTYSGTDYKIHSKAVAVDGQGNAHHTKVWLMKWTL